MAEAQPGELDILWGIRLRTDARKQPRLWEMDAVLAMVDTLSIQGATARGELRMEQQLRRAEVERLQVELEQCRQQLAAAQEVVQAAEGMWAYAIDYATLGSKLQRECNAFRASADAAHEVVTAARRFDDALNEFGFEPAYTADSYQPLHDALARLDAAQQEPATTKPCVDTCHVPCTNPEHLNYAAQPTVHD